MNVLPYSMYVRMVVYMMYNIRTTVYVYVQSVLVHLLWDFLQPVKFWKTENGELTASQAVIRLPLRSKWYVKVPRCVLLYQDESIECLLMQSICYWCNRFVIWWCNDFNANCVYYWFVLLNEIEMMVFDSSRGRIIKWKIANPIDTNH